MRSEALWTQIIKSYATKESWRKQRAWERKLRKLLLMGKISQENLDALGEIPQLKEAPPRDPSIASQLREAKRTDPFNKPMLVEAYMEAVRKCPEASASTKRKWRRIIGVD